MNSNINNEELNKLIVENGYSITLKDFDAFTQLAKLGDKRIKASLVYMMTECNYHEEAKMIENGMYDEARESLFTA